MKKIRVKIVGGGHSAGRGVGFYWRFLTEALEKSGQIELVEANEQVLHYPFFDLFYPTLPSKLTLPTVVTIHDLTPLVLGEYYPQGIRGKLALWRQRRSLDNVSAILTDSFNSKNDLVRFFHLVPDKIFVTPLAADPEYQKKPSRDFIQSVKRKYRLPDKFILYVGGINANKNLVRLARAAINLNLNLVLVGSEFIKPAVGTFSIKKLLGLQKTHPEIQEFQKLKKLIEGNGLFQTPGYVPTEELNVIYRLATVHCQPSLYEGFGLPLLEAMIAGCLVVSSNAGSLLEIYPAGTLIFDPTNQTEIETTVSQALALSEKERKTLIKSGQEKAKNYSWEKTAKLTLDVYRKVIGYN